MAETQPGGRYEVGGQHVNAHGTPVAPPVAPPIKPVKDDETPAAATRAKG